MDKCSLEPLSQPCHDVPSTKGLSTFKLLALHTESPQCGSSLLSTAGSAHFSQIQSGKCILEVTPWLIVCVWRFGKEWLESSLEPETKWDLWEQVDRV